MRWHVIRTKGRPCARRTGANANVLLPRSNLGASFHRRRRPASGDGAAPSWFAFRQEAEEALWLSSRAKRGICFSSESKGKCIFLGGAPKLILFSNLTLFFS